MDHPVFSIIIPSFNSGKTIQRAFNSLLDQCYTEFEIFVVDGLSTDNTLDILHSNAEKDDRIRFISEKDTGIYDAMNKGIRHVTGTWIYFLGSDDRLLDNKVLEKVFSEIKNRDYNLLYGNILSKKYGRYGGWFTAGDLLKKNISHQAMFFHKTIFEKLGNFNIRYRTHADWEFNLRCFDQAGLHIKYIDLDIAEYSTEGASSVHEVLFFREVILPRKLKAMNSVKQPICYSIAWFDEWWRFLRNAQIKTSADLESFAPGEKIQLPLGMILIAQHNLSRTSLSNGLSSKLFMTITYFRYLFSRILNKI